MDSATRNLLGLLGVTLTLSAYVACGFVAYILLPFTAVAGGPPLAGTLAAAAVAAVLVVSAVRAAGIARRQIRAARRLAARVEAHSSSPPPSRLRRAAADLSLEGRIELIESRAPFSFVHGFLDPRVAISRGFLETLDDDELRAVLAHERYHVRKLDPARALLGATLVEAFFLMPSCGALRDRYMESRELAADRAARRVGGVRALGGALLKAVEGPAWHESSVSASLGAGNLLAERIEQLETGRAPRADASPIRIGPSILGAAAFACLFAGAMVGLGGVGALPQAAAHELSPGGALLGAACLAPLHLPHLARLPAPHPAGASAPARRRPAMRDAPATVLPPGPRAPAMVNMARLVQRPLESLLGWHRRHGDLFTVELPVFGTGVYVCDPDAIRDLFTGDQSDLHAGEANAPLSPVLGDRSVLVLDGAEHLRQRRLLLPPFQGSAVQSFRTTIREVAGAELDRWRPGDSFVLRERMRALTFEVIVRAVFGVHERARIERLRSALAAVIDMQMIFLLPSGLRRDLGGLGPWARFRRRLAAADALLYEEIERRRRVDDLGERSDVLSLLLLARYEDGGAMTDAELRDELMTMLLAGHETTATGLAFAFDLLLRDRRVLSRLRDELAGADDSYLDAVVSESLRLRPVIDAGERTLTRPRTIRRTRAAGGHPGLSRNRGRPPARRPLPAAAGVPARALHRARGHLVFMAAVRRRHPTLRRRGARAGRDGGGDPCRNRAGRTTAGATAPRTGRAAWNHAGPETRDAGRRRALDRRSTLNQPA
jgi:cytochrome P450/Zn-dependent protease with chaperone function